VASSIPYTPISHPFVERLIGTIRREYLDNTSFWGQHDLARKLGDFKRYYNEFRLHSSLAARTLLELAAQTTRLLADLNNFSWKTHCRGLFQTPPAA
jgi:transposase InsO family protein